MATRLRGVRKMIAPLQHPQCCCDKCGQPSDPELLITELDVDKTIHVCREAMDKEYLSEIRRRKTHSDCKELQERHKDSEYA